MEKIVVLESGLKQMHKICPKCNLGNMWPNGIIYNGEPTLFEHKCVNCEHLQSFERLYPYTVE